MALDRVLYPALFTFTVFLITAVTVAVCPTFNEAGKLETVMLRAWLYPSGPWHELHGLEDAANTGDSIKRTAIVAIAPSRM